MACPGTIQKCACQPRERPVSPIPAETGQPNTWMLPYLRTQQKKKHPGCWGVGGLVLSPVDVLFLPLLDSLGVKPISIHFEVSNHAKIAQRLAVRLVQVLLDAVFHLAFGDVELQKSAAAFVQVGLHVSIVDHMAPIAAIGL